MWEISVEEKAPDIVLIKTRWGVVDGKMQTTEEVVSSGVNTGRANYRSPREVALQRANRRMQDKLKQGYQGDGDTTLGTEEFEQEMPQCMLAQQYVERVAEQFESVWVQPKLDGVRCIADVASKTMCSRTRRRFTWMAHIATSFPEVLQTWRGLGDELPFTEGRLYLDGELYLHKREFQSIVSIVKREPKTDDERKAAESMQYHVFDCFVLLPDGRCYSANFEERYSWMEQLRTALASSPSSSHIRFVQAEKCALSEIEKKTTKVIEKQYEGVMVRDGKALYRCGCRARGLLKLKRHQDEEFTIIGFEQGKGKETGCVIWVCETPDGTPFSVRPLGTYDDRRDLLRRAEENFEEEFRGRKLTVKFEGTSTEGVPRFPVGIGVRDYE